MDDLAKATSLHRKALDRLLLPESTVVHLNRFLHGCENGADDRWYDTDGLDTARAVIGDDPSRDGRNDWMQCPKRGGDAKTPRHASVRERWARAEIKQPRCGDTGCSDDHRNMSPESIE